MEIINAHAAGIDIGSRSHFVVVSQALEDEKEFGVYAEDLSAICCHLKRYGITSVAMESTGDYWQNLFTELIKRNLEVILCNGKFIKHAKGKKTDVKDARWIQKLHRWIITEPRKEGAGCGRSLVLKVGDLKRADISIAKFSKGTREVGGAHNTNDCSVNKIKDREGGLL